MPLQQGNTAAAKSANIRELMSSGRDRRQAVAIAMDVARRSAKAMGGPTAPPVTPWNVRQEAREAFGGPLQPPGLINSPVPGRTDRHEIQTPAGSYIIPSDVVSGLGENNTLAGAAVLDKMMNIGPYGTKLPQRGARGSNIPHPPAPFREGHFAGGGDAGADGSTVPIVVAGGEYLCYPNQIKDHPQIGAGNLDNAHRVMDAFVKHVRKRNIKTLSRLPGPRK